MKSNIRVDMTGIHQRVGQRSERVDMNTEGKYRLEENKHIIEYDEKPDETDKNFVVHNIVVIEGNKVTITRAGNIRTEMIFEKGTDHMADYVTPYGIMKMNIKTLSLNVHSEENKITIGAEYIMEVDGQELSQSVFNFSCKS